MKEIKRYIVVMDYSAVSVSHYHAYITVEDGQEESEAIENWLRDKTEHHLSNCSWMSSESEVTYNF